ncbi:sugar phosphate isomerase/epimerase family protein [Diplocloster agilis]|uniref:sugar phosphate isomerase/epimerase family protein n=1 Tax=Diplocloster agilis TaxID=2850323 RepID=UPI000820EE04|nr:TIM barrel protein [Suonthocola fibrivorans]MCU6736646.1 sugar phosphate isomerase/epimerase [Suonthocola fibrivorans]SCJ92506.1 Hydroxypyruvate isomerase [uncultured Clostridium sp.]
MTRESIHEYFQIGTLQWMSYPGIASADAVKKIASDSYFDAVEISPIPEAERDEVKNLLDQSHLSVSYGAHVAQLQAGWNPNSLVEKERRYAQEQLQRCIDEAAWLGAATMSFLAGRWEEGRQEEHLGQLVKTTAALCRYAKLRNMSVELEVFDYDVDKRVLIGPASLAAEFAAAVRADCRNFGLIVDLSHIPLTHESMEQVVQILKPYITHVHIGNAVLDPENPAYGDQHPRFGCPAGRNDVTEVAAFLQCLRAEGVADKKKRLPLSFEVKPRAQESADIILCNCKRTLNAAWRRLE